MLIALISLGGLFTDHMVLQRERANAIWGRDEPRQEITLVVENAKAPGVTARAIAGDDGHWRIECPELPAGGPYRLRIKGSSERVLEDVLVGDVWVASGQSNMEFSLDGAQNAAHEIAAANFPAIRYARIPHTAEPVPQSDVTTAWTVCQPAMAGWFSAVGYFFAADIHRETGVPIGVIDASWGGTPVESWTSREALAVVWPESAAVLADVAAREAESPKVLPEYREQVAQWEKTAFPQDESNEGEASGWARSDFNDAEWRTMPAPGILQRHGFVGNGVVWLRRTLELPANWAGRDLVLELGPIDDFDTTYFNGERVGATGAETLDAYQVPRRYVVPGRLVQAGANVLAVRVFDRYGDGGLREQGTLALARSVAEPSATVGLAGEWRWAAEKVLPLTPAEATRGAPPRPAAVSRPYVPSYLFNGMIAPLVSYGVRGFIWYQGEANVGGHANYAARFTAMIRDWRTRWGLGTLPFYFVQLAGFEHNGLWPHLREAQASVLREPGTGMAVAIDVGEARDIHPKNKRDVGARLARIARSDIYGQHEVEASGPVLQRVEIEDGRTWVHLAHAAGLRTRDGGPEVKGFALAGADRVYHPATARIEGAAVVVEAAAVELPCSVRYAWADYIEVNLENGAGLPAQPFRTDGD